MSAAIDIANIPEAPASGKEVLRGIVPSAEANPLFGILTNWHWMTVKYADVRGYKDVHWAGGKRAAVTMFTSAAWQASGIAIEDFRVKKAGAKASAAARYDLYFRLKETDYFCGAVTRWHDYLKNSAAQHCDAAAWFFPLHATENLQDARLFFPGCAVFVKECRVAGSEQG